MNTNVTLQGQLFFEVIPPFKLKRKSVIFYFGSYLNKKVIPGLVHLLVGNNKGRPLFKKSYIREWKINTYNISLFKHKQYFYKRLSQRLSSSLSHSSAKLSCESMVTGSIWALFSRILMFLSRFNWAKRAFNFSKSPISLNVISIDFISVRNDFNKSNDFFYKSNPVSCCQVSLTFPCPPSLDDGKLEQDFRTFADGVLRNVRLENW